LNSIGEYPSHLSPPGHNHSQQLQDRDQCLRFYLQPAVAGTDEQRPAFAIEIGAAARELEGATGIPGDRASTPPLRQRVVELVNIPLDRVLPMPHLSGSVMGVYNWRGEILWIVDCAKLLDLHLVGTAAVQERPSVARHRYFQPTIVVASNTHASSETKTIGLAVDEIAEIEGYEPDLTISSSGEGANSDIAAWIKGYGTSVTGEKLAILDIPALFDRADLHANI
jgi:positive phototaxis protein PixI